MANDHVHEGFADALALATKKPATLHQALSSVGLASRPGSLPGKRQVFAADGRILGEFDAAEGWGLVRSLRDVRRGL